MTLKSPAGKLSRGNERGLTRRAKFVSEPIKRTFIISGFRGIVLVLFVPIVLLSLIIYSSAIVNLFLEEKSSPKQDLFPHNT